MYIISNKVPMRERSTGSLENRFIHSISFPKLGEVAKSTKKVILGVALRWNPDQTDQMVFLSHPINEIIIALTKKVDEYGVTS
jgi:hypothetical protein